MFLLVRRAWRSCLPVERFLELLARGSTTAYSGLVGIPYGSNQQVPDTVLGQIIG